MCVNKFKIYFCANCDTGFTNPSPKNINKYYHTNYWITPGIIGRTKNLLFKFWQKRRIYWVKKYLQKGKILDIGAGEGNFAKNLPDIYKVVSIDSPKAKIQNPNVKKVDFIKWKTKELFDAAVFWESLEHTINPQAYLRKAYQVLNKKGLIFIEYPRFNSLEAKIFGKHWFHLDTPRHLSHLTDKGLSTILKRAGFASIKHFNVPAFEYTLWGFIVSILSIFNIKLTDKLKQSQNLLVFFSLIPLGIVALMFEVIILPFKQSPIGLVIASKGSQNKSIRY